MAILERLGDVVGHALFHLEECGDRISIGADGSNDLVIDGDPAVSRVHALLERVGPAWCISDVGSTNGTLVNGERVLLTQVLAHGDEILIGRTRLRLSDRSPARGSTVRLRPPPEDLTPRERDVLVELCRPVLSGRAFTPPASVREIAAALYVSQGAVKQHLDHLYDKFLIEAEAGVARRVVLANEAIQSGAVVLSDLHPAGPDGR
ncbi:MAG: FHA domain-containing protein [Acidimicrobiia bacterium]